MRFEYFQENDKMSMSVRDQLMYKISLCNCHFSQLGHTVNKEGVILQRSQMAAEATSATELSVVRYLLVAIWSG